MGRLDGGEDCLACLINGDDLFEFLFLQRFVDQGEISSKLKGFWMKS